MERSENNQMVYDFTTRINRRGLGSTKWNQMLDAKPNVSPNVVPLSMADMEYANPPEIRNGLKVYIDQTVLGYTRPTDAFYEAVIGWQQRKFGYDVEQEWIKTSAGVVPALFALVEGMTKKDDGIILTTPVYYPFFYAVHWTGRNLVTSSLHNDKGYYSIDFDDLEEKASRPENTLLLFCNPHNPSGRVWTEAELIRVAEICAKHKVLLVSDEIHQDLIMPGYKQITMGNIAPKIGAEYVVCTGPSKTFNLAGMETSTIFIPNKEIRDTYWNLMMNRATFTCNILGYKAVEIAYTECDEWLAQLIAQINKNQKLLCDFFAEHFPDFVVSPLESTYLSWVDFRSLGIEHKEMERMMRQEAEVFLNEGYVFGDEGIGFERFNIACPSVVLSEALERIKTVFKK